MTADKEPQIRNSALHFFVLVYALSAPFWVLQLFIDKTNLPLNIPITDICAAFTPLVAACILTYKENGKTGVKSLLSRIIDFKKPTLIWWPVIVLLPLLIFCSIYFFLKTNNYPIPDKWTISFYSIPLLLLFFYLGAIGEEVGYMGYAVDKLQNKFSAFCTSIIIGVPWIIWHYPSILQQGRNSNFIFWGTLGTIAFRTIYVWLYNNTNKSLSACIILHCLYNTGRVIFPSDQHNNPLVDFPNIHYGVLVLITITITLLWGHKTLTNFMGQNKIENTSR